MKKNMHSVRVSCDIWLDPDRFEDLMTLLKKYPCGIGQVSLFTAGIHPPVVLAQMKKRSAVMKERLQKIRKAGLSGGINILATIGHHEENLDHCFSGDYFRMTNDEGAICRGSFCMNDKRYVNDYVIPVYRMLAQANPDYIWIDDDIRYGHLPIGNGCFCQCCIEKFNQKNHTDYTRDTLRMQLDGGDLALRQAWLDHNTDSICGLFRTIGETVREIDPAIRLGWMTGERYFEGYNFAAIADALSDGGKYEIFWRPGGGAYTDYRFDDIVEKQEQVGRQNAFLPSYVTISQYEIENFPYQLLKKTPTSTALEAALSMTSGCTGAAFNILPSETGESLDTVEPWLKTIHERLPFYTLLAEKTAGKQPTGIGTGWRINSQIAVPKGRWSKLYGGCYASFARELFDFGLPQSYRPDHSVVTLLTDRSTLAWTDDEIREAFTGGIYLDAGALDCLNAQGYSSYTGFKAGAVHPVDAREYYLPCKINDGIEKGIRNCRQAFNHGDSYGIIPDDASAEVIAKLIDYENADMDSCCIGMYENELGGRICAAGYYPFSWVSDYMKTIQLKRIFVNLSKETLPSYVETYCRIRNHTFVDGEKITVTLCNPGNEPLSQIKVAIRTNAAHAVVYTQKGDAYTVNAEYTDSDKYRFFTAEQIPPYEMVIIEA